VADTEQILRLVQSIPSKKAEPFKMWLAQVGKERIDESIDPEISIERAILNYRRLGYSENWINQRIKSIEVRIDYQYVVRSNHNRTFDKKQSSKFAGKRCNST